MGAPQREQHRPSERDGHSQLCAIRVTIARGWDGAPARQQVKALSARRSSGGCGAIASLGACTASGRGAIVSTHKLLHSLSEFWFALPCQRSSIHRSSQYRTGGQEAHSSAGAMMRQKGWLWLGGAKDLQIPEPQQAQEKGVAHRLYESWWEVWWNCWKPPARRWPLRPTSPAAWRARRPAPGRRCWGSCRMLSFGPFCRDLSGR